MARSTQAVIRLDAIRHNLAKLANLAGNSKIIAVVKADAYGNGAINVALAIQSNVDILAVAIVEEALELRQHGISKPILILQGPHQAEDLTLIDIENTIWMVHSYWQLKMCKAHMQREAYKPNVWLKFDTGMHRLGFGIDEYDSLNEQYTDLIDETTVMCTHLACADEPEPSHAKAQIERFLHLMQERKHPLCIANSATNIRFDKARQDYVRLGIALYGSTPFQENDNPIELEPVMNLESTIMALRTIPKGDSVGYGATWTATKETTIATVALGYADGYPRHAPSGTPAFCNGQIIPLVGRVSMDMLTFDVSGLDSVKVGDTVQLWGDKLAINHVADCVGTIGYELMTRIGKRVPRVFK